ncbi:MAG: hypothetical protein P8179_19155 [Candidatus Thiodiazotropha sp.]
MPHKLGPLDEVIERWQKLFTGGVLVSRYRSCQNLLSRAERNALGRLVSKWRERLSGISWFARSLNESLARGVNQQDRCSAWSGKCADLQTTYQAVDSGGIAWLPRASTATGS